MSDSAIRKFSLHDLMRPELRANPYPWYRRLRDEDPVHEDPRGHGWLVTRYDDVVAVLDDARFSAERLTACNEQDASAQLVMQTLSRQMLFLDPPDHTRLRKLFAKSFTPRRIEAFRPQIEALTHELLTTCCGRPVNFIKDFAVPLPVMVIAMMLGVPVEDRVQLRAWSAAFGSLLSGRPMLAGELAHAQQGIVAFEQYFARLIALRRAMPEDDMLSDLVAAEEAGDRLSEQELISNLILLLAAGHGTTTHLLGNGLLALAGEREQWNLFVSDPDLAPSLVNEVLRFEPPVQVTGREATDDVELGGQTIRKGERVRVLLGAANRDERHFVAPDTLNVQRFSPRVLSFGHGVHSCIGAMLARFEAQIVFAELAARFPGVEVAVDRAERTSSVAFRGLRSLPVTLR
ncbi:cytochrome P450 [Paraburkholderia sp. BCC1885]|uniref:cytochrome P450 n=1 Tax=Paraburkholderia sp. BCC1885 TaxID=2562669 RepID=UPI001182BF67|nr:cytochrome P450 [Paraburkholderia sp. BCC1885]